MREVLRFHDVSCVRGGRTLFQKLNLMAWPEQAVEIAGPNGSGKSSLLRLAAGLLEPTEGTIDRRQAAGLIDEGLALDPAVSLVKALSFWARIDRIHPDAITGALEAMGIAHLAAVPVRLLSTGQRKRASFARLLASQTPLWLLDEPLNGLDGDGIARLTGKIRTHLAAGNAILYASHVPIETLVCRHRIELGR